MSHQRLNLKKKRRIETSTGLELWRAWGNGGYVMHFVTVDHRHGYWDSKTGAWALMPDGERIVHFSTCEDQFGHDFVHEEQCCMRHDHHLVPHRGCLFAIQP